MVPNHTLPAGTTLGILNVNVFLRWERWHRPLWCCSQWQQAVAPSQFSVYEREHLTPKGFNAKLWSLEYYIYICYWCVLSLMGFSECDLARNWKASVIYLTHISIPMINFLEEFSPSWLLWYFLVTDSICHLLDPPITTWFMDPQLSHGWTVEHRCPPVSAHQPWPFHAPHILHAYRPVNSCFKNDWLLFTL